MLPSGHGSNQLNGLLASQTDGNSVTGSADISFSHGLDVSQALRPLSIHHGTMSNSFGVFGVEDRSRTNLIINYLPQSYEQADLQRLFERLGPIRQCKLIRDKNTGASLCYGFVDYMSPVTAQQAIATFHGFETEGKRLRVAFACSGGRKSNNRSADISPEVCVDNILGWEAILSGVPHETNDSDILNFLSAFGNIIDMKTQAGEITNGDGLFSSQKCKNVSIIYEDKRSCEILFERLDGHAFSNAHIGHVKINGPVSREAGALMLLNQQKTSGITGLSRFGGLVNSSQGRVTSGNVSGLHRTSAAHFMGSIETNENSVPLSLASVPYLKSRAATLAPLSENQEFSSLFDQNISASFRTGADTALPKFDSLFNRKDITAWHQSLSPQDDWLSGRHLFDSSMCKSPSIFSAHLTHALNSRGGIGRVELKLENLQRTGSVCFRAMDYAIRRLAAKNISSIVCPSTGNAGVAAAAICADLNIPCTVVVPDNDVHTKRRLSIEAPSTNLVCSGSSFSEALLKAEEIVMNSFSNSHSFGSTRLLHPYEGNDIHLGYEGIIFEMSKQPDVIVVPVGGGALLCGIVHALCARNWTSTHVVAVEPEGWARLQRSLTSSHPLSAPTGSSTLVSTLAVAQPTKSVLNACSGRAISIITCSDSDAIAAAKQFVDDHGYLLDLASAIAVASVYNGSIAKLQSDGVIRYDALISVIITGGRNISLQQLSEMECAVKRNQPSKESNSWGKSNGETLFLGAESVIADLCNGDDSIEGSNDLCPAV